MLLNKISPIEERPLTLVDLPIPVPNFNQILVKISACGICHTDLHEIEGERPPRFLPIILGHQIVGKVEARGPEAKNFKEGDRVGICWLNSSCQNCSFCQQGNENLCAKAEFTGYDVQGGYSQYTLVSENFAYSIPQVFSDLTAAPLLCAGIIGFRALRLSQVRYGQILGLYGFGSSAHLVIQVARYWNCQVFVFTRSKEHQELAKELGAEWVGWAEDQPPAKFNSAIIFAPAGSLVPKALENLEKGGRLILAGIYMSSIPELDYIQHLYFEKEIKSVANVTKKDAQDFLSLAAEIPILPQVQEFKLKEANEALILLKQGKIQGTGVLRI